MVCGLFIKVDCPDRVDGDPLLDVLYIARRGEFISREAWRGGGGENKSSLQSSKNRRQRNNLCLDYFSPYNLLYGSMALLLSYIITTLFDDVLRTTLFMMFCFCLVSLYGD